MLCEVNRTEDQKTRIYILPTFNYGDTWGSPPNAIQLQYFCAGLPCPVEFPTVRRMNVLFVVQCGDQ